MNKKLPPPPIKVPTPTAKNAKNEKKAFNPEDYVTMTIPLEEVKDIKLAFDVFDEDGSGTIDPQ
jgi:Ca2+-binding EF-hand superfamily protein